jgi:excisionase family DNA binding protein
MGTTALPDPDVRPTLTVEEAGELLGIGRSLAYEKAASGELPSIRLGRRLVIPTASLLKLLGRDIESTPRAASANEHESLSGGAA